MSLLQNFTPAKIRKIAKMTGENQHWESLIEIAKTARCLGTAQVFKYGLLLHNAIGYLPIGLSDVRYEQMKELFDFLETQVKTKADAETLTQLRGAI